MFKHLILSLLATAALARPLEELENDSGKRPSVTIANGTVIGKTSQSGIDTFRGIPFAQPPVGDLRLRPPQPVNTSFGVVETTNELPHACPQIHKTFHLASLKHFPNLAFSSILESPLIRGFVKASEDCLTLDLQRPANVDSNSKLPVLFWIFGGGFEVGSTQGYDGTSIVKRSIAMGKPIVYVQVNSRVAGFGFMPGKELAAEGSTNLGLRDQRLGLQWVQDNIEAFGGDPDKVTIWGESAGAISAMDHTIINGGDHTGLNGKPLFRGAIMNSGSLAPADPVDAPQAQGVFNKVAEEANCGKAADKLACLGAASFDTFKDAVNIIPGLFEYGSIDLNYSPRPDRNDNFLPESPELAIAAGKFARVPVINGDQEDEGTFFYVTQLGIINEGRLIDYMSAYFPGNPNARADFTAFLNCGSYPNRASAGSPFGTG